MSQIERIYRIHQIISERGCVPFADLQHTLEISRATLKRDIAHLRDRLNAPIVYDRDAGGYRYDANTVGPRFQLPGLWFTADEAFALMTMHELLSELDASGLLSRHVKPLMDRLSKALGSEDAPAREVLKRVKLMSSQRRRLQQKHFEWFELVGRALMTRRRLSIDYFTRSRNERSTREISPQRLVHYRGNWYLDAWCHKTDGVRMFALDSIEAARLLEARAKEMSIKQVDDATAGGYGIYRGTDLKWATLVFSEEAARWVRAEVWHEQQTARNLPDGRYELKVPYSDSRELEMDILRHGENVQVLGPPELRDRVLQRLRAAVEAQQRV